jgi:hypothetical protein
VSKKVKAIGIFENRQDVFIAIKELRAYNYPLDRVLIVTKDDRDESSIAGIEVCDREEISDRADGIRDLNLKDAATGAVAGGAFGGVAGLLIGLTTLAIPGVGPVTILGTQATALASTLSSGAIGAAAGGFVGSLVSLGIPQKNAEIYNEQIKQGKYLLLIQGSKYDIIRAESMLGRIGIKDWQWSTYENQEHSQSSPEILDE